MGKTEINKRIIVKFRSEEKKGKEKNKTKENKQRNRDMYCESVKREGQYSYQHFLRYKKRKKKDRYSGKDTKRGRYSNKQG
jgi:hypothetical protein